MAVPTSLQGKTTVVLQTTVQGKTTVVLATELRAKTSVLELYTIDTLVRSARIVADVNARMVQGTFEFEGSNVGGINSANYWKQFTFHIPDYNGVQQPVFVGFFPSSQARRGHTTQNETLIGYDFSWYLSQNNLAVPDLVLLTPAHQATLTRYQLHFDFQEHYFQVGNIVVGGTTGHTGRIVEVVYGVFDAIILENPTGVFQDDEELLVGGHLYAYADGIAVDVTGTVDTINPEDWIERALGGEDWNPLFGLEPYRIASTAGLWGGTKAAIDFSFRYDQSIYDAIQEPTKYLEYIFFSSWRTVGDAEQPCIYWVPNADIDDGSAGLDLPAAVTITNPDGYLVSLDVDQKGEGSYNKVTVRCRLLNGTWYTKVVQSSGVDAKTERVRNYPETAKNIGIAADCDARCQDLYNYLIQQAITWKAVFLLRSDFRRLQKLTFSGYSSYGLPDGTYRILKIEYDYGDEGTLNRQIVTMVSDAAYLTYMSLNRSYSDTYKEMQAIAKAEVEKYELPEIGTVSSVDGTGGAMYASEDGLAKPAIDADPA